MQIDLDERLVAELDRRAGRGRRTAFIARTIERALDDGRRWEESALGSLPDKGHNSDEDAARWVHESRRADAWRSG